MWHKQSFTQFWSQSDAYSRRSSLKLTYIHHPLVVCTHQICCAVAVPIALSQDRLLHGHNRLVNWTPCSRMREQAKNWILWKLKTSTRISLVVLCFVCLFIMSIHKVPQSFRTLFRKNNEYHSYSTRSAHHLHIPSVKLDLSKTGIKYRGSIVWNIIAESGINLEVSEAAFKKSLIKLINTDRL